MSGDDPVPADDHEAGVEADAGDVPEWDDEYLDRVADALKFNYDLEKDRTVEVGTDGSIDRERFDLYGLLRVDGRKQFLHPSITFANSRIREHLFVRRVERATRADLERLVALGHDLADEWIEADETHQGTEFTFVLVAPQVTNEAREFVEKLDERTLLKYGYFGHYEIHLAVVAPEDEAAAVSDGADVARAFTFWTELDEGPSGIVGRLLRTLRG